MSKRLTSWLRDLFRLTHPTRRAPRARFRPWLEFLEARCPPAVILVNTTAEALFNPTTVTVDTLGPTVSLRDAINAANNTAGSDSIVLAQATYTFTAPDN